MSDDYALSGDGVTPGGAVLSDDGAALEMVEATTVAGEPGPHFVDLPTFVTDYVATTWIRETGPVHWCPQWWRHREAQVRLEALWRAYEEARVAPSASARTTFLRVELDYHLTVLTSASGPFWGCDFRRDMHRVQEPWPVQAPPAGLFLPDPPPSAGPSPAPPTHSGEDTDDGAP